MDDLRFGAVVRAIRIRRSLRQIDLARLAGVSQSAISRMERGHAETLALQTIRRVAKVLDIRVDLAPRWRAGDLDRLLNASHSQLHDLVARHFQELPAWVIQPEVSFAVYAERGVIDILAWHPGLRALLVIELKTDIVDVNELVGMVDRKRRHAVHAAVEIGWIEAHDPPPAVSVWLIVADSHTNRRRVQAHGAMLRAAFPADGRSIRGWLQRPDRAIRVLSFWPVMRPGTGSRSRPAVRRVRASGSAAA